MRACFVIAIMHGVLLNSSVARAQLAGALDLGSGLGQLESGAWLRESRVSPALRFTHRAGFAHMDGSVVESGGAFSVRHAAFDGAVNSPTFGLFRASLAGNYLRDSWQPNTPATRASVSGAISAKVGASGAWMGATRALDAPLAFDVGVWRGLRSAVVSITSQSQFMRIAGSNIVWDSTYNDTTGGWNRYQRGVGRSSRIERWSDLEARVDWAGGRLALSAAVSGRRSRDSTRAMSWGRATVALQLNSRVALVAGGGTLPSAGVDRPATARFATFGLRLSQAAFLRPPLPPAIRPSATAFHVQLIAPGTYRLTLRVPNARSVELSGDFNQWTPIALRETSAGTWEATIALRPGTHRVNIRVDGDTWTAPPGLPALDDEFSGRVGILIVK